MVAGVILFILVVDCCCSAYLIGTYGKLRRAVRDLAEASSSYEYVVSKLLDKEQD